MVFSVMTGSQPNCGIIACYLYSHGNAPPISLPTMISEPMTELGSEMQLILDHMRYLTYQIEYPGKSQTTYDLMYFSRVRTSIVHRLLCLAPAAEPSRLMIKSDYCMEFCRLGFLIYVQCALHMFLRVCPMLRSLKQQLVDLMREEENIGFNGLQATKEPVSVTWSFMMGSLLSSTEDEEIYFARKIATSMGPVRVNTWEEMEDRLRDICWLKTLRTDTCQRVWTKVEEMNWGCL